MHFSKENGAALAALGVCAAVAGIFVVRAELHSHEPTPQPAEFVVRSFTYDPARHIGEILAGETFTKPTTKALAASAMEATLQASAKELSIYFPDVPKAVRDGNFACHVIDTSRQNRHYDLFCMATATSAGGQGA